jgi:hypothetical protein
VTLMNASLHTSIKPSGISFFSKFSFIIIPQVYHTQISNFYFLIWSNIKNSAKSAVTVLFFVNFENQFSYFVFRIIFQSLFYITCPIIMISSGWVGVV